MKTIDKIYTDFITADDKAARNLLDPTLFADSSSNQNIFKQLVELLYPNPPGAFLHGRELWNKVIELTSGKNKLQGRTSTDPEKLLAKIFRIYYANLGQDAEPLERDIFDYYKKHRESVTYGYDLTAKDFIEGDFRRMLSDTSNKLRSDARRTSLMYILVDSPSIDLKMRNANKAEAFLNYVPSHVASQLTPYLSAEFSLIRNVSGNEQKRTLDAMSPLRFLMGDFNPQDGSADAMLYDAAVTRKIYKFSAADFEARGNAAQAQARKFGAEAAGTFAEATTAGVQDINSSKGTSVTTTGMEMFTMPQTLLNMDYRQDLTPRYNPVINPTLPFGSIVSFTMNVTPSVGVISFKTASMVLKIYDRSRLVEIADFINPKLYKSTTIWVTYGWIAPATYGKESNLDVDTYYDFINDYMIRREAYGVRNSSMTIENDGSVTVTLSLFTQAAQNILEASDADSFLFDRAQEVMANKVQQLSVYAKRLGLQATVDLGADVRGSNLLKATLSGNLVSFDAKELDSEIKAIRSALSGRQNEADVNAFIGLLNEVYSVAGSAATGATGPQKPAIVEAADQVANQLTSSRFMKLSKNSGFDCFSDFKGGRPKRAAGEPSPLARMTKWFSENPGAEGTPSPEAKSRSSSWEGPFGSLSFGHLFAYYFGEVATALSADDLADEFQVIFYKLNDSAGPVGGINIAEFPIHMGSLEAAYKKRVADQKSERMSLDLFLDVVRQSQFGDIRHPAFGFRDLYKVDKAGELTLDETKKDLMTKRLLTDATPSGPFTMPAIEYYIETGFATTRSSDKAASDSVEVLSTSDPLKKPGPLQRIIRIHVYDKASSPHKLTSKMFKSGTGTYVEVDDEYLLSQLGPLKDDVNVLAELGAAVSKIPQGSPEQRQKAIESAFASVIAKTGNAEVKSNFSKYFDYKKAFRNIDFSRGGKPATFSEIKNEISRLTPTLLFGANGSMIQSISYNTAQDALLSTIMMLRNSGAAINPSQPNGSADGTLPLRVVAGQLSVTTFGCPLVEYMQQFFVDLGTGTTADNLYNITGLTHNISPGKFSTEIKFTFSDAYGQYESAQDTVDGLTARLNLLRNSIENSKKKK